MRRLPMAAVLAFIFAFAAAGATLAGHAGPLTASCSNPELSYTVNFPNNWYYNLRVESDAGDIPACSYFSPDDFSLTPGSEPTGVSIGITPGTDPFDPSQGEQVMVGDRDAVRYEVESTTPGFEGMYYTYVIDMGSGETIVAQTSDRWVGPYEENKEILDAMMNSLVFGTTQGGGESPTAMATSSPTPAPTASALPDAAVSPQASNGANVAALVLGAVFVLSSIGVLAVRRR